MGKALFDEQRSKAILAIGAGVAGALLIRFMSWRANMALVAWLIPLFLIYCFRHLRRTWQTVPVALLCVAIKTIALHGGWDISLALEIAFGFLVSAPLLAALFADRILTRRALDAGCRPGAASLQAWPTYTAGILVFPTVYTALDFLVSRSPVGMTFSLPYTQSMNGALMQITSLFGSWSAGFLIAGFAALINTVLQLAERGRSQRTLFALSALGLVLVLGFGSARLVAIRPTVETVRIGSVSVAHPKDFWALTDAGTPRDGAPAEQALMRPVNEELFRLSQKAVDAGARIVFWSEGNHVHYEDQEAAFVERAGDFARRNGVYLLAGSLTLRYGSFKNDNRAVMFAPDGSMAFAYEKTYSWYPTDSDGVIRSVDTPYGRIAAAICFDMDFPGFIRQAGDADIMLVPAYDTRPISPFHTEAALLRGIENGFSVVRQCNAGTSMAADFTGTILASQDFYTTPERMMIADVPTKGVRTLYERTGDWLAWACLAGAVAILAWMPAPLVRQLRAQQRLRHGNRPRPGV